MRKLAIALTLAALTAVMPAAEAAPTTTERRFEDLWASFRYRDNGRVVDYILQARKVFDAESGELIRREIYAGKIPCHRHEDGILCEGTLHRQPITTFRVRSDMSRAVLRFGRDGRHRLEFDAGPAYDAGGRDIPNGCGGVTTYEYEYAYNAIAQGRLFGRDVHTRRDLSDSMEHMERFAKSSVCP